MWKSDPLWLAIDAMAVAPAGMASGFAERLARENGWSGSHAEAVSSEYRRFLYLSAKADGPLTPSEDVDQAWHLHLLHTRHYWDHLCGSILRGPLHHDPAGIGSGEAIRHRRQYEATLARYRATFGEEPPQTIWPGGTAPLTRPLRIDAARYWLVPRMLTGRAATLSGSTILIGACSALAANAAAERHSSSAAGIVAGIALTAILVLVAWLLIKGGGGGGGGRGGCSASCGAAGGSGDSSGGHGGHGCGGHGCGSGCGGGH